MLGTLVRWLILTLAVWVAAHLVPGITYDHWQNLLIAALVLGILNAFVKPILMLISLPLIFVTFGFFSGVDQRLAVNGHFLARAGIARRLVLVGTGRQPGCQHRQPVFGYSRVRSGERGSGPGFEA